MEQIKEFWEWCGWRSESKPYEASFTDGANGENFDVEFWYSPLEPDEPQAEPELDLNNLFKYALPKAIEKIGEYATLALINNAIWDTLDANVDLATALYQALRQIQHMVEDKE